MYDYKSSLQNTSHFQQLDKCQRIRINKHKNYPWHIENSQKSFCWQWLSSRRIWLINSTIVQRYSDIYRDLHAGEVEIEILKSHYLWPKGKITCASIILASSVAHQTHKDLFKSHYLCGIYSTIAAITNAQTIQIIVKSIILICPQVHLEWNGFQYWICNVW